MALSHVRSNKSKIVSIYTTTNAAMSASVITDETSENIDTTGYKEARICCSMNYLNTTNATLYIDTSPDGGTRWFQVGTITFTTTTVTGVREVGLKSTLIANGLGDTIRTYLHAGATTHLTCSIWGVFKSV